MKHGVEVEVPIGTTLGEASIAHHQSAQTWAYLVSLTIGALGVVFGDVGTSVLYAMRECFHGPHALAITATNVLGVLSLIVWSLIVVISVKYQMFVLRADNNGEGGILSMMALNLRANPNPRTKLYVIVGALFSASLFYGDGMITPAVSVLSAVEGLKVATPFFEPYIIPITIGILTGLFAIQRRGTAGIGAVFGPITLVWFLTMALLGLPQIFQNPGVLAAVNPVYAIDFFITNQGKGFLILGSVFLVVTGGEALYADMGHFGKRPIRLAWFALVLPCLLINYFGQGALLLANPAAAENPFYNLAPSWGIYPLVILAAAATCIASQAVISGAFSLTKQAVQLGYLQRVKVIQTSEKEVGQIYIPVVNWLLYLAVVGLVLGFRTSSNLTAAYGIAVSMDGVITTILLGFVARNVWKWSWFRVGMLATAFLLFDLAFFTANAFKIPDGGWLPLVVGAIVFNFLSTWKRGREVLADRIRPGLLPLNLFFPSLKNHPVTRVNGNAVFMTAMNGGMTPPSLLHHLKHNRALHNRVVLLTVKTGQVPTMANESRLDFEVLDHELGFYRLAVTYGFMEDPDVPAALEQASEQYGLNPFNPMETSYYLGRETLLPLGKHPGMGLLRQKLFALMAKFSTSAGAYYQIPPNRVVELGMQVEL